MTEQHTGAGDDPQAAPRHDRTGADTGRDDTGRTAEDIAVPDNPLGMPGTTPTGTDPGDEPPAMAPGDPRLTGEDEQGQRYGQGPEHGRSGGAADETDVPTAVNEEPPG